MRSTLHMSLTPEELKEQRRQKKLAQKLEYNRSHQEELKLAARARSKAQTLETTARRIKGHTLEDLIKIAQICYKDRYADFVAEQDSIVRSLQLLQGPTIVLNQTMCKTIQNQSSASSSD